MFQVCPVCNGEGSVANKHYSLIINTCTVCRGEKIISQITGKPPCPDVVDMQKKKQDELTQEIIRAVFENTETHNIGTPSDPLNVVLNKLREFSEPNPNGNFLFNHD
jgi:hypothetical protein